MAKRRKDTEVTSGEEAVKQFRPVTAKVDKTVRHLLLHIEAECPFCLVPRPLAGFRLEPLSGQGSTYSRFLPFCPSCNTLAEVDHRRSFGTVNRLESIVDLGAAQKLKAPKPNWMDSLSLAGWAFLRWNLQF